MNAAPGCEQPAPQATAGQAALPVQTGASGCSQQLAALRESGAHRFEPVRFHYLELLAQRAQAQPERVRQHLEARLAQALAEWSQRREQACQVRPGAQQQLAGSVPAAAATLVPAAGTEEPASLAALTRYLAQHAGEPLQDAAGAGSEGRTAVHPELKSVRNFRNTWSKLSVDRQVAQALHQAPKNAGPINSHMLVLRSLALMRDISPDYLNRFMTYADTLLSLEHNERAQQAAARAEAEGGQGKKAKSRSRRQSS